MILLTICNGSGIFRMGKIKPDKRMVGSIRPSNEINMATIWFGATVEINIPKLNAININRNDSPISRKKLPLIGTPKTKTPNSIMVSALMNDKSKYGVTLPNTIWIGFSGDASRTSMVPISFSLLIEMEVIMAEISIKIIAMIPGTNM